MNKNVRPLFLADKAISLLIAKPFYNSLSQNTEFTVQIADFRSSGWPPGKRVTVNGNVGVPWAPLGLEWDVPVQATTFYPVWEFYGE